MFFDRVLGVKSRVKVSNVRFFVVVCVLLNRSFISFYEVLVMVSFELIYSWCVINLKMFHDSV